LNLRGLYYSIVVLLTGSKKKAKKKRRRKVRKSRGKQDATRLQGKLKALGAMMAQDSTTSAEINKLEQASSQVETCYSSIKAAGVLELDILASMRTLLKDSQGVAAVVSGRSGVSALQLWSESAKLSSVPSGQSADLARLGILRLHVKEFCSLCEKSFEEISKSSEVTAEEDHCRIKLITDFWYDLLRFAEVLAVELYQSAFSQFETDLNDTSERYGSFGESPSKQLNSSYAADVLSALNDWRVSASRDRHEDVCLALEKWSKICLNETIRQRIAKFQDDMGHIKRMRDQADITFPMLVGMASILKQVSNATQTKKISSLVYEARRNIILMNPFETDASHAATISLSMKKLKKIGLNAEKKVRGLPKDTNVQGSWQLLRQLLEKFSSLAGKKNEEIPPRCNNFARILADIIGFAVLDQGVETSIGIDSDMAYVMLLMDPSLIQFTRKLNEDDALELQKLVKNIETPEGKESALGLYRKSLDSVRQVVGQALVGMCISPSIGDVIVSVGHATDSDVIICYVLTPQTDSNEASDYSDCKQLIFIRSSLASPVRDKISKGLQALKGTHT